MIGPPLPYNVHTNVHAVSSTIFRAPPLDLLPFPPFPRSKETLVKIYTSRKLIYPFYPSIYTHTHTHVYLIPTTKPPYPLSRSWREQKWKEERGRGGGGEREKNRFVDGSGGHRRFPPDVHVFCNTHIFRDSGMSRQDVRTRLRYRGFKGFCDLISSRPFRGARTERREQPCHG